MSSIRLFQKLAQIEKSIKRHSLQALVERSHDTPSFVKKHVPEMSFASDDTPYAVEYQLWEDEEGKYLSAINLQYADEVLPVFDFNICIRTEKPAKITRVSDGREMGFEYSDGKLVLHIDRLDLYEMFDIQI